jgi:hypothetical protein
MLINPDTFAAYEAARRAESQAFAAVEQAKRTLASAERERDVATSNVRDLMVQLERDAREVLGPIKRQSRCPELSNARYTKSDVRE